MNTEEKAAKIYTSESLKKEVVMWVNMYKIKKKDVELNDTNFKQKLKAFTKRLQEKNTPVKKYDFNNDSVLYYLKEILN